MAIAFWTRPRVTIMGKAVLDLFTLRNTTTSFVELSIELNLLSAD